MTGPRNAPATVRAPRAGLPRRSAAGTPDTPLPGLLKRFSENAGAVGLALGLVLSTLSLYDVLVRKPEAARLAALSQFNQTVNSAARTRQEILQSRSGDPVTRLSVAAMAVPRILNDVATARALLPALRDEDVGIPQLLILISESLTAGDTASAGQFVERAVNKKDVTPVLAAEALRAKGKYLFVMGRPEQGRAAYLQGLRALGDSLPVRASKAFHLADLIGVQYASGHCAHLADDARSLLALLNGQGVPADARIELLATVNAQIGQFAGQACSGTLDALRPQ